MGQVRPDRQTLLFTATMPTKVDNLVRDCLTTPVRITVGEVGAANQDIQQASFTACSYLMSSHQLDVLNIPVPPSFGCVQYLPDSIGFCVRAHPSIHVHGHSHFTHVILFIFGFTS